MNITRKLQQLWRSQIHTTSVQSLRTLGRLQPITDRIPNQSSRPIPDTAASSQHHVVASPTTSHFAPRPNNTDIDIDWSHEMHAIRATESRSVLEPVDESFDPNTAVPNIRPTHNLAAYVKNSATLQQFIQLGVDLHRIERRKGLAEFVLGLDWQRDIQSHLRFLSDVGLPSEQLGAFITCNPLIFKENIAALTTRINYLQSKSFEPAQIARIVDANPFWLMFRTQRIDGRLGFFQKQFELSGSEVRQLVVRQPRLITYGLESVRRSSFLVREELGFSKEETKQLLLTAPKLWMMSKSNNFSNQKPHSYTLASLFVLPPRCRCRQHYRTFQLRARTDGHISRTHRAFARCALLSTASSPAASRIPKATGQRSIRSPKTVVRVFQTANGRHGC